MNIVNGACRCLPCDDITIFWALLGLSNFGFAIISSRIKAKPQDRCDALTILVFFITGNVNLASAVFRRNKLDPLSVILNATFLFSGAYSFDTAWRCLNAGIKSPRPVFTPATPKRTTGVIARFVKLPTLHEESVTEEGDLYLEDGHEKVEAVGASS